jgi:hypothetical protein
MEADISTWRKTGHFYFALTRRAGHEERDLIHPADPAAGQTENDSFSIDIALLPCYHYL